MAPSDGPYHHGDLRRALIDEALGVLAESGPAAISLRDLARRIGVSHAAPTHHFGDKRGLFTAIATEGYGLLADTLAATWTSTHDFSEVGVAYTVFAVDHRGHFVVMFRPDLVDGANEELRRAAERSRAQLYTPIEGPGRDRADTADAGVASWALVHGLAELWVNGALGARPDGSPDDGVAELARRVTRFLRPHGAPASDGPTAGRR